MAKPDKSERKRAEVILPPEIARHRVLDTKTALAFVSLSASQWRELRGRGEAPTPVQLSPRKQGYRLGDLMDWVDSRKVAVAAA